MQSDSNAPRSAGAPPAVSGATRPRFSEITVRCRGRLPHWERECGCYFVTFRLADSIPKHVARQIAIRKRTLAAAVRSGRKLLPSEAAELKKFTSKQFESYLDAGSGSCALKDERIAQAVAETLRLWNGERYRLLAWCIMPNHVHVVFRLLPGHKLADVVLSWKSFTAKTANEILGQAGTFWQREYYDRLIRDSAEFERAVNYVLNNPIRAGLNNWKWVEVADGL